MSIVALLIGVGGVIHLVLLRMSKVKDLELRRIYYDHSHPAGYGSVVKLYKAVNRIDHINITKKYVEKWLKKQDVYTLHKPTRKKFKRNRVEVYGIDSQWQADLADLSSLQKLNNNYRYLLVVIDCFSKYTHVIPIKTKSSENIIEAFEKIVGKGQKPITLQTDKGTEFTNRPFQKWLKDHDIRFFTSNNETKCSIVERMIRTLKSKLWKYFTAKGTSKYLAVLQSIVKAYNNSYHRSIGRAPSTVNIYNQQRVKEYLYGDTRSGGKIKYKFKVGMKVRISKNKMTFEKGYRPNWTEEIFVISQRIVRYPPVYRIKDLAGELLEGTFYEYELQEVDKSNDALYIIDKVIKQRKRKGKTEYYVSWENYPSKFNSWVTEVKVGPNI